LITFTNSLSSGLFSAAGGSGNAGRVVVSTPSLMLGAGGEISVATSASGNAGTVRVNAGSLNITGGLIDSSTTGGGDGGAIFLNGSQVNIANGGRVTADSLGAGRTGNVTITASDSIVMSNGSISTRAATSDGGDITLTAPNIVRLEGSQISTSVESGTGSGGNVRIDPQFLIVNGSSITANAFGGPGGNITIIADNYLPSPTSIIEASSALSTPGSIQIASPENNVAGSIAQLPRALVDASRLMRSACSARREGTPSSFTLAGRGGVPPDPDGYLPSAIATAPVTPVALARMDSDDCAR
jgi:hypothetical protein